MDLPALHVTGWFDGCAPGEFHHFREMVARSPAARDQSLLVGAWGHGGACTTGRAIAGAFDLGPEASLDSAGGLAGLVRPLAARHRQRPDAARALLRHGRQRLARCRRLASERCQPHGSLYLHADGSLAAEPPTTSASRSFAYDPADPTPGIEQLSSEPLDDWSPRDLAFLERRADVLVYTSERIRRSDRDRRADPPAVAGIEQRRRYRLRGHPGRRRAGWPRDLPQPRHPARVVSRDRCPNRRRSCPASATSLPIEMADLGHVVLPGHRLRVIVTSCLFPYYHPNPNTGASYGEEGDGDFVVASQTVFADPVQPSRLTVFVRRQHPDEILQVRSSE